mgnify:FL=1
MKFFLGIDIGTYESKGILTDKDGNVIASATNPHKMLVPEPGWAEHRPEEDWWNDFVKITKKILKASKINPGDISCIATSAIGPCMLPVSNEGYPLMNAVLYGVDTRAEKEIIELNQEVGKEKILQNCGNALTSQSVGPKILWLKKNCPEIYKKAGKILSSTSYLVQKLTGESVIDHYTAANFTPLYDIKNLKWTDALTKNIIEIERLPKLMWTTEIAGYVSKAASKETGLAIETPVTVGTIDAAAEAISVGVCSAGDMMMMYGSTIFIIQVTNEKIIDGRLWYAPWLFKGLHGSMAGLATSGTLTHWFRDNFAKEIPKDKAFEILAAEAAQSPPGSKGLIVLPYFSGERTPIHDPKARGTIFGLDLTHNRGDIFRAFLEGIAMGTAQVFETYEAIGQKPKKVMAVGGGTKNNIWMQATSDFSQIDQVISEKSTGASYGNAFLAALAVGAVSQRDITNWNPALSKIKTQHSTLHAEKNKLFRQLYERSKEIAHAVADST